MTRSLFSETTPGGLDAQAEHRAPRQAAQRDEHAHVRQQIELTYEKWPARVLLVRCRAVGRRSAAHGSRHPRTLETKPVAGTDGLRPVR